jgi:hypothetical protein
MYSSNSKSKTGRPILGPIPWPNTAQQSYRKPFGLMILALQGFSGTEPRLQPLANREKVSKNCQKAQSILQKFRVKMGN